MSISEITIEELRRMEDQEGLVLRGCGGPLQEWLDGINGLLTEEGILKNGTRFENISTFQKNGVTCLLFPFTEDVQLDMEKLPVWRFQTRNNFGSIWLSDYVPNYLGGFIQEVEHTYDAWGKLLTTSGSMADTLGEANSLRYRSYVYDSETGLYYLQSRYYDPEIGRFINADSLASTGQGIIGTNMFAYCNNNIVNYLDDSGQAATSIVLVMHVNDGGYSKPRYPVNEEGNYSNFSKNDLYSTQTTVYDNISKSQANKFYEEIKREDFQQQLDPLPMTAFFSLFSEDYGDTISDVTDILWGMQDMAYSDVYDPKGNILYLEEGFTVCTVVRVFIGDGYSASETEYFIFDENRNLVFNDVRSTSYIVD